MGVTIRQIAKKAHVSPSTVSRCLRDYPHVDETTRSIILQAAADLGYPIADQRKSSRISRSVLLLAREDALGVTTEASVMGREFERKVTIALQSVFQQQGITTRLELTRMDQKDAHMHSRDPSVAGLVLLGGLINHDFVRELQQTNLPFIVAGAHVNPLRVNCVMSDYLSGMQQAVAHLASHGRRCIGLVNGPDTTSSSYEKYCGMRLALAQHDLPFSANQVVSGKFDAQSGYESTYVLLKQRPDLDAIAYSDDDMAIGGLRALRETGRRVPADVAITGFYDQEMGRFTDPPLTSVHLDLQLMGVIAARRLCTLLQEDDHQPWTMVVPTSLVARGSG